MEGLVVVLILLALVVAAYAWFTRTRATPTPPHSDRAVPPAARPRAPTVETLRPGDAVSFWDGEDTLVDCVLACEEQVGTRRTRWRWTLLRSGRLLETAPDGNVLYTTSEVLYQGTPLFEQLTAEPAAGGVLKTFEARVRAGTVGANPVFFDYQGRRFQVRSTGTFRATPVGAARPSGEVWRDIADDPTQNVYFELEAADGVQGLGIWTTHILLLVGEPLKAADIRGLFPGPAATS
jgi:hypothetical protein